MKTTFMLGNALTKSPVASTVACWHTMGKSTSTLDNSYWPLKQGSCTQTVHRRCLPAAGTPLATRHLLGTQHSKAVPKTWLVTNTPEFKRQMLLFFFEKAFTDSIRNFTREGSARLKPNNYTSLFGSSWKIRAYFPVPVSTGHQPLRSQVSGAAGLAQPER